MDDLRVTGTKRNAAARSDIDPEYDDILKMLEKSDTAEVYDREHLGELKEQMEAFAAKHHVDIININGRKVLQEIVAEVRPHRVLELGTAIGFSSMLIAENAAPDVEITTMELIEKRVLTANYFINHSPFKGKIKVIPGSAGDSLNNLSAEEKFDFVYIDAAKAQYPDYFRKVYGHLTENAVVVADNVLFRGLTEQESGIPRRMRTIAKRLREYIDMVSSHSEFSTEIRHDGDGLAISRRISC